MLVNIFVFISLLFILTFIFGKIFERFRIPWIFAALVLGAILSLNKSLIQFTTTESFTFIAQLGMYFLLFIIGFDIDVKEIMRQKGFLFRSTLFIISLEAVLGASVFHFLLGYSWLISLIVGFSFATVGEAVLIPILDEFKIVNTKLGQAVLGIGILDDLVEVAVLIVVVSLIGINSSSSASLKIVIISLLILSALTYGLTKLKKEGRKFKFFKIETLVLFSLAVLFLFLGIGEYAGATSLAAFLAGISLRTFIPRLRLKVIEKEIRAMAYGLFAPIFFFWVGASMDFRYLISYPWILLMVLGVSIAAKLVGSILVSRNYLTTKEAVALGVGLSVRFSTSIVIVKILLDSGIISRELYSVIIASSIILTFMVPIIFSRLILKWKLFKD